MYALFNLRNKLINVAVLSYQALCSVLLSQVQFLHNYLNAALLLPGFISLLCLAAQRKGLVIGMKSQITNENERGIAMCGLDCSSCKLGIRMGCKGCTVQKGQVFWGKCIVAACCGGAGHPHCGRCKNFVCEKLHKFAYDEKQGDQGERIERLRKLIQKENE